METWAFPYGSFLRCQANALLLLALLNSSLLPDIACYRPGSYGGSNLPKFLPISTQLRFYFSSSSPTLCLFAKAYRKTIFIISLSHTRFCKRYSQRARHTVRAVCHFLPSPICLPARRGLPTFFTWLPRRDPTKARVPSRKPPKRA